MSKIYYHVTPWKNAMMILEKDIGLFPRKTLFEYLGANPQSFPLNNSLLTNPGFVYLHKLRMPDELFYAQLKISIPETCKVEKDFDFVLKALWMSNLDKSLLTPSEKVFFDNVFTRPEKEFCLMNYYHGLFKKCGLSFNGDLSEKNISDLSHQISDGNWLYGINSYRTPDNIKDTCITPTNLRRVFTFSAGGLI